jgi:hypothetical protein
VAPTLVVSVTSKSYLCKLIMILHGPLGQLLLSVTTPCREGKPIARLVNFLLITESMQSVPYSLGEAYLKVNSPGWWALLNCSLTLNCADLLRRFSSQNCKIESMCLIGLAKGSHPWLSSEQDCVLLEIRNRNEESCLWSLIAITSLNLAIMCLPRYQTILDTSITMFTLARLL